MWLEFISKQGREKLFGLFWDLLSFTDRRWVPCQEFSVLKGDNGVKDSGVDEVYDEDVRRREEFVLKVTKLVYNGGYDIAADNDKFVVFGNQVSLSWSGSLYKPFANDFLSYNVPSISNMPEFIIFEKMIIPVKDFNADVFLNLEQREPNKYLLDTESFLFSFLNFHLDSWRLFWSDKREVRLNLEHSCADFDVSYKGNRATVRMRKNYIDLQSDNDSLVEMAHDLFMSQVGEQADLWQVRKIQEAGRERGCEVPAVKPKSRGRRDADLDI